MHRLKALDPFGRTPELAEIVSHFSSFPFIHNPE
jgi:hypothetical protein